MRLDEPCVDVATGQVLIPYETGHALGLYAKNFFK